MSRTSPVELPRELAAAARRLLERSGPRTVSHRNVAAEAGVATKTIANRFGSIDDLLDYVALRAFAELIGCVLGPPGVALAEVGDPAQTLSEALRRYRAWALANAAVHQLMFSAPANGRVPSSATRQSAGQLFALFGAAARSEEHGRRQFVVVHGQVCLELSGLAFPPLSSNP